MDSLEKNLEQRSQAELITIIRIMITRHPDLKAVLDPSIYAHFAPNLDVPGYDGCAFCIDTLVPGKVIAGDYDNDHPCNSSFLVPTAFFGFRCDLQWKKEEIEVEANGSLIPISWLLSPLQWLPHSYFLTAISSPKEYLLLAIGERISFYSIGWSIPIQPIPTEYSMHQMRLFLQLARQICRHCFLDQHQVGQHRTHTHPLQIVIHSAPHSA